VRLPISNRLPMNVIADAARHPKISMRRSRHAEAVPSRLFRHRLSRQQMMGGISRSKTSDPLTFLKWPAHVRDHHVARAEHRAV